MPKFDLERSCAVRANALALFDMLPKFSKIVDEAAAKGAIIKVIRLVEDQLARDAANDKNRSQTHG